MMAATLGSLRREGTGRRKELFLCLQTERLSVVRQAPQPARPVTVRR